jgi:hypothetical protein
MLVLVFMQNILEELLDKNDPGRHQSVDSQTRIASGWHVTKLDDCCRRHKGVT